MGHYYDINGNPCHTVIGKNGKERATTIRDARSKSLFPSVTTVLGILAKPGLDKWKFRQVTDACFNDGEIGTLCPDEYNRDMMEKAFDQVDKAADAGTLIHAGIEAHFTGEEFDYSQKVDLPSTDASVQHYVQFVSDWVAENDVEITESELRLVNTKDGYAGLTDAVFTRNGYHGIMDFKTRKTVEGRKVTPYDDQACQIAAYHIAKFGNITDKAVGCNLYISTTELGRVEVAWYDSETLISEWVKFQHCLSIWKIIKKYNPAIV